MLRRAVGYFLLPPATFTDLFVDALIHTGQLEDRYRTVALWTLMSLLTPLWTLAVGGALWRAAYMGENAEGRNALLESLVRDVLQKHNTSDRAVAEIAAAAQISRQIEGTVVLYETTIRVTDGASDAALALGQSIVAGLYATSALAHCLLWSLLRNRFAFGVVVTVTTLAALW